MFGEQRCETLHEEFERIAARFPDRVAVVDEQAGLTYAELDQRADAVAAELRRTGAVPGLVGLVADRSVSLIVGIIAILKAGGAYVPLDPDMPAARRDLILNGSGVRTLLVDRGGEARSHPAHVTVVAMDVVVMDVVATDGVRPHGCAGPARAAIGGGDLAYVIYTSGSTGVPRGVMVEHRQVLSLLRGTDELFDFTPDDTWTLVHSYAFDFSVWEIFGALLHGARLVVVPGDALRSPRELWNLIRREGVTVLSQTPTYFVRLDQADDGFGGGLRYVVFGGEALEFPRLRSWFERYGGTGPLIVNMYGITETTVHTTFRLVEPHEAADRRLLIGRALPHATVQILDDKLRPVPLGAIGEICVGGAGLARGYLGDDGLTQERFVADPRRRAQRLYRSGDQGRMLASGELEYAGRMDDQVKVRGYRIELGEIRQRLREHQGIADAAVIARRAGEATQLVAYFVPKHFEEAPKAGELRDHAALVLPEYMIPGWFISVPELPVNHNGKLDVPALPEPGSGHAATASTIEPAEPAHAVLDRIWRQVLDVDALHGDDRFYAVGGDSIQAIRIVSAAREHGIEINIDDLIANPTITSLAQSARNRSAQAGEPATEPISLVDAADAGRLPDQVVDAYPLTALQLGMVSHADDSAPRLYHAVSSVTVNRTFEPDRFRDCLRRVAHRHEVLRTSFDLTNFSEPLQLVWDRSEPRLTAVDLSGRDESAIAIAVAAICEQEQSRPLDLSAAPLARFRAVLLDGDRFVLVWTEHHAILDGWSSANLLAEVIHEYAGTGTSALAMPAPAFRDYVAAELAASSSSEHRDFWQDYLRGVPRSQPVPRSGADAHEMTLGLPAGTYRSLHDSARAQGVTPKALFVAAVAGAIGVHQGSRQVILGDAVHGRLSRPGSDQALGLFLNTTPVRIDIEGSWRRVAASVTEQATMIWPHRRYPLSEIYRTAGPGFRLDAMVNFIEFQQVESLVQRNLIGQQGVRTFVWTDFPLLVEAERRVSDGELDLLVQFKSARWTQAARAEFCELLKTSVREAIEHPDAQVPHEDRAVTVVDDILRTAGEHPERIAIADGKASLSYRELILRTRQLARVLRQHHIRRGDVVAISLPRNVDLLVAWLAVFWVGAVLLPIDPAHPLERRRFLMRDAGAVLALVAEPLPADAGLPPSVVTGDVTAEPAPPDERPACASGDPAYVLYTSGSTGHPKGVEIDHANLRAIMRGTAELVRLTADDVVLGWSSVAFDFVFAELFAPLMAGARVELLTEDEVQAPTQIRDRCAAAGVSLVEGTPSKLRALAEVGWPGARKVLIGGESLPADLVEELARHGATVWNGYGPTETTVFATMHKAEPGQPGPVPIGRPLPGVKIRIVAEDGTDVAKGAVGELWIGGAGVGRRYIGLDELTAERFVLAGSERYYRSGDFVRTNARGELEFHGRIDQQVKVNGVRIELHEIEHVLCRHEAVHLAAILPETRPDGGAVLTAYVAVRDRPVSQAELRDHLEAYLPAAMVPGRWLFTAELPLTVGGKIDRQKLSGAAGRPRLAAATSREVRGQEAELVADAWMAVLSVAPLTMDDHFFELGGDSLAAMRLVGQYSRRGVEVRVRDLLEQPTVAAQAKLVALGRGTAKHMTGGR